MLVIRLFVVLLVLTGAATAQDAAVSDTENFRRKSSDDQSEKADYVRELEDSISARSAESDSLSARSNASRARFGQMTDQEQTQAIESFKRIGSQDIRNASRDDVTRIRNIGTDEAERLINEFIAFNSKADELFSKLVQDSKERTRTRISYAPVNVRTRLTALLEKIERVGVLGLNVDDVLFVTRDEAGVILLPHVVTVLDVELRTLDENTKLTNYWHDIAFLFDTLALERYELEQVLFWSEFLRSRYIHFSRMLTAGEGTTITASELAKWEKDRPLLSKRILDYTDGTHTRTRQYARKFETVSPPPPRGIVRPPVENLRVWTSKDGNFTTEAAFKRFEKGVVTLEKNDYSTIDVPLDNLSPADRAFVQKAVRDSKKK